MSHSKNNALRYLTIHMHMDLRDQNSQRVRTPASNNCHILNKGSVEKSSFIVIVFFKCSNCWQLSTYICQNHKTTAGQPTPPKTTKIWSLQKNLSITSAPSGDSRIVLAIGSVIPSAGLNWLVTIIVTGVALANVGDIRGARIRDRCGIFNFEKVLDSVPKMLMTVK